LGSGSRDFGKSTSFELRRTGTHKMVGKGGVAGFALCTTAAQGGRAARRGVGRESVLTREKYSAPRRRGLLRSRKKSTQRMGGEGS